MGYEFIETARKDGLATIILNRPPANVLNIAMMGEINNALEAWQGDKDLKVVLFKATGKCFSAGVDVGEHMGDLAAKMIEDFHRIFRLMDKLGTLTIASVYGNCLGGGCELAIYCDLVVADESAKFGQPEINIGIIPGGGATQRLPRLIGVSKAKELIYTGEIVSAEQADRLGLVNRVVTMDELMPVVKELAKKIATKSAAALKLAKTAINRGMQTGLESGLQYEYELYSLALSLEDRVEGVNAFLEKRAPKFVGR